jgi:hypothetical protein
MSTVTPCLIPLWARSPMTNVWAKSMAHFMIDYGHDHDLQWVCFVDATGECWTVSNKNIRLQENITVGRLPIDYNKDTSHDPR